MPQDFFEPRRPADRARPPGTPARSEPSRRDHGGSGWPDEVILAAPPHLRARLPGEPAGRPRPLRARLRGLRSALPSAPFVRARPRSAPRLPARGTGSSAGRRFLVGAAVAAIVGLISAGVVFATVNSDPVGARPRAVPVPNGPPVLLDTGPSSDVRAATARWIISNVGPGHVVACDAAMCGSLAALGFPASSTVWVKDSALELQSADVAVLTSTLRARMGSALTAVTAAQPLATFGTGSRAVTIQAVAHAGRASYERASAADLADRRLAGAALAANSRLTFTGAARAPLERGLVDMRICALLATLSSGHTLTVVSFAPAAPGAGAGVPRNGVEISVIDTVSAAGPAQPAVALRTLIAAQQAPYRPLRTETRAGPAAVLSLLYSQPAPVTQRTDPAP
ncbi:hypothetical protein ABZ721_30295 [Streptomyces sp. NPDC006733]|uniref:hypothetical protein n=1 Tax=Streptomyces sp. NPDC006733 TaxID=3155460 RepID=UPI0033C14A09